MRQAWRWYGPDDPVTLDHVRQAGAREIVTALHQYPPGVPWPRAAVAERKALIEHAPGRTPLAWTVVESIPLPDDILRASAGATHAIEAWIESMRAVAAEDIRIICYNVMPVVDWTRTDLDFPLPTGATALRFDHDRFAAFDLHVLGRENADVRRRHARACATGLRRHVGGGDRDADQKHLGRTARRHHGVGEPRRLPRSHRQLSRRHAGEDARQRRGLPRTGRAGRRATRRAADLASGRSAASAVRPAAHRLDRGRLPGAVRRGAVSGERHLPLRRQPRQPSRQRRGANCAAIRRAHLVRASARHADR